MFRTRRIIFTLLAAATLCTMAWQSGRTQSSLRRITNTAEAGINLNPSLSGDGRFVAFESTEDVSGAGSGEGFRALRANVAAEPASFAQLGITRAHAPAISQDGSRIAFASFDNPLGTNGDGNSEIFLYDGTLIQVTNTSPGDSANRLINGNFQPSLSDDGRFIAFSSNRDPANQNADGNLEIFVYDTVAGTFLQATNTSGIVGFTDAKISGDGNTLVYIRDTGQTPGSNRTLVRQNRQTGLVTALLATNVPALALTYGRAVSDDGLRAVWSAQTATNTTQVFLYDGRNNETRQITTLGSRATDVALLPTISGDGSRIAFATRRSFLGNTDGGVDLYTFDVPSSTFARVTAGPASATAEVVSSLSDDGSLVAFNYPRVLSGPVSKEIYENDSEIYLANTPPRPASGSLTILNRASLGHEPSSVKAVAPDSIATALGSALAFTTLQGQRQLDGTFPTTVGGTTVRVNGLPAQIFFVSPGEVHFLVPRDTVLSTVEVVVSNSDGFESRGTVPTLRAAPGTFSKSGDGLGEGLILNADTLSAGPFDPSSGTLHLLLFTTGVRNASLVTVTAAGRTLGIEHLVSSFELPGLDEVYVLVPAELRGAGVVDLVVRTDGRDSNPVTVEFTGDSRRDVMINEFLADPPDGAAGDANHDGVRDSSDDEFIELVNTTTHDIDLLGYRILTRGSSATTGTVRHQFAGGSILPACTSLVLFGGGSPDSNSSVFGGAQVYKTKTGSLSLTNSGGVITLLDDSGATVDSVAYGGASGLDGDANQSLTRAPDITGPFSLHKTASDRLFSPGTRLNGAPFALCSPISSITISPAAATIEVGQQQQFTAHAFDAVGNEVSGVLFSWEWDNVTAATLEQSGLATGNAPGTTEIRAVARGVRSASPATLTVKPASPVLTTVTLSPANATVGLGETPQFTAQANDQFGQDIGGVDISFASSDLAVASVNPSSAASATGSAIVSLTTHFNGTTEIRATATDGTHTVTSSPSMLTVEPGVHELVISEFRTRGPNGAADEFVELYNPSRDTLNIGGLRLRAANGSGTVSDRVTITAGKTLDSGCHYLIANSSTGGFSGSASPDQSYATGVTDDGGLAITGSNGTRIIDAVGMSSGSAYKEGAPLAPLAGNLDQGYERKPGGSFGNGNDRDDNASDFKLTAPGNPQNSSSGCLDTSMADLSITMGAAPDPVTVGSNLTYTLTITNNGVAFARRIIVRDDLPAGVSFVSCAATGGGVCGGSGNTRRIDFASLESGASATVTLLASANGPAGATITNTATVESILPDIHKDNNSATTTAVVQAPLPALSINDVAAGEGDSGTTAFRFTVSLTAPAPPGGVTFSVATADNTATSAGSDYAARSVNTQSISSGDTSSTFEVIVNGDTLVEGNETFFVNLFNVTNASVGDAQGQGTIKNDDTASLVVSQVYAGGGNSGAQFAHDFVELFNHGTTTLDFAVTPYSVQYAGATAAFGSNKVDLTTGLMAPGQYFLVQLASGGANGSPLPAPDATGSIAMAATAGKVALVFGTTALSGNGCPLAANVADFAGYGTTADCFEGAGRAPAPGNTTAALRKAGGCTDTNDNAADFLISAPFPRNASSPLNNCSAGTPPNLAVNDVTVTEGNSGTTALAFTVSLSAPAPATDITFDIATHDNTATTASGDYVARSLTNQLLPAGQTSYTFTVNLNGDLASEPDESFFVNLTNVSGATVAKAQGVGTIRNDDFPSLTIDDVALAEGNSGSKLFTFTVGLSTNAPGPVTFDLATQDNSATVADNDYVARGLSSQTIPAGNSTYTFDVSVNGDTTLETNETFLVNVTNVSGATVADGVGAGTIQNDDSPALSVSDVSQSEGNSGTTAFSFTVTSSLPAPPGGITFDIATADGTAHDQVPATEDHDYVLRSLTAQTIPAGDTSYTFAVTVNGDTLVETNETFFVNLTNVTNASLADGQGQGTILNDDAPLLVISQVYGGGGNAGATYTTDFIEIFNRGVTTVDFAVTPYSVQYAAATSNFSTLKSDISSGVLLPGHYFLVQEGSGGAVGVVLPTPDATGSINLAATAGKVALVSGTTGLSGNGCPLGAVIVDFLGYGNTASCFETAPVSVSGTNSNARSLIRTASCTDNNNNATDFSNPTTAPLARNTATAPTVCP